METPSCATCPSAEKCPIRLSRPAEQRNTPEPHLYTHRFKKREVEKMSSFARNHVFVVRQGCFKSMMENGDILHVAAAGELYGTETHYSQLNNNVLTRPLVPDIEICSIATEQFETLMSQRPALQKSVLRFMARGAQLSRIGFHWPKKSLRERTIMTLIYLRDRFGVRYGQFRMIDVPLTKIDIASMMCTVQESAVRILSEFREEGLISANGKRIVILDSDRLDQLGREIAQSEKEKQMRANALEKKSEADNESGDSVEETTVSARD